MHRISCTEALARLVALLWGCTYLLEYLQASLPAGLSFEYATVFELQNVYQLSHSSTASGTSKIDIQSGANSIGIEDGPTGPSHSAQFFVSDGYHAGQFYIQVRLYEPILSSHKFTALPVRLIRQMEKSDSNPPHLKSMLSLFLET